MVLGNYAPTLSPNAKTSSTPDGWTLSRSILPAPRSAETGETSREPPARLLTQTDRAVTTSGTTVVWEWPPQDRGDPQAGGPFFDRGQRWRTCRATARFWSRRGQNRDKKEKDAGRGAVGT